MTVGDSEGKEYNFNQILRMFTCCHSYQINTKSCNKSDHSHQALLRWENRADRSNFVVKHSQHWNMQTVTRQLAASGHSQLSRNRPCRVDSCLLAVMWKYFLNFFLYQTDFPWCTHTHLCPWLATPGKAMRELKRSLVVSSSENGKWTQSFQHF